MKPTRFKKALVTGGAGFIGSELCRQLATSGIRVICLDNLVNGKKENVEALGVDKFELRVGDLRDAATVKEAMDGVDVVFHLACLGVRHSIHSPEENHSVNASGTLGLLMAAQAAGVKRFVYVSSSEVYGTARWVPMTEDHPAFPKTVYGASKLAGENYTRAFFDTYGFPTVVVRPFNTYGPRCHHEGDSGEVIPKFMLRGMAGLPMIIFGDGTQTRDFTEVQDTARGIQEVGFCDAALGGVFNLGSGAEITVKALASEVATAIGKPGAPVRHDEGRPGDVLRLFADNSRAKKIAGFAPTIGFREGLLRLKQWYDQQGVPPEELLRQEVVRNWV